MKTPQIEFIDLVIEKAKLCAIPLSNIRDQEAVCLIQIALRMIDELDEDVYEKIMLSHRHYKKPNINFDVVKDELSGTYTTAKYNELNQELYEKRKNINALG